MRHESCFCPSCSHYNAEAGVVVSRQADEIVRLRSVLEGFSVHEDPDVKYPAREALEVKS